MTYSRYPSPGSIDDDLPVGRAFDDISDTRRRNRMKQANAPAPRAFTQRDIAQFEKADQLREVQQTARAVRQDELRI